jgi:hypothetical protein
MPSCNRVLGGAATETSVVEAVVALGVAVEVVGVGPEIKLPMSCVVGTVDAGTREPAAVEVIAADPKGKPEAVGAESI